MIASRRLFLGTAGRAAALVLAAPAIVKAASLMPVRALALHDPMILGGEVIDYSAWTPSRVATFNTLSLRAMLLPGLEEMFRRTILPEHWEQVFER